MPFQSKYHSHPPARRTGFFFWIAILLLLLNIWGFAPTFFFRKQFNSPELPLVTQVHGAIFSAWFVLFIIQASLIRKRRIRLHKRFGIMGVVLAIFMIITGLIVLYFRVIEYPEDGSTLVGTTMVAWGNFVLLTAFSVFVFLGFRNRRVAPRHKRFMLLASMSMMGQSLGRIGRFPGMRLSDSFMLNEVVYGLGGLAALLLSIVIHDLIVRRRVHPVTAWGAPLLLASIIMAALLLPKTTFAQALILLLN
jgi:uncharacterized membrane protein YozB (DUF420 family)